MPVITPERTVDQRMSALAEANRIRIARAQLKRDIRAGKVATRDVIAEPSETVATMHIFDLLITTPKIGRVKANRSLQRCRISPSKTIGGLSERQRAELLYDLWKAAA